MSSHEADDTIEALDPLLQAALDELPERMEPTRDLWAQIDAELSPETAPAPRGGWRRWAVAGVAAAACLVVAFSGWRPPEAPVTSPPPVPADPIATWASDMQQANGALVEQLGARDDLSPEVRATIDANLRRIDEAILDVMKLLEDRPDDPELQRWLSETEAMKQRVLVAALRLPEGS